MERTFQDRLRVIQNDNKNKSKDKNYENRRVRKLKKQTMAVHRIIAWLSNELHRRKVK